MTYVHVARQIGPCALHTLDFRLAAQYTLRPYLERDARHFGRKRR